MERHGERMAARGQAYAGVAMEHIGLVSRLPPSHRFYFSFMQWMPRTGGLRFDDGAFSTRDDTTVYRQTLMEALGNICGLS